MGFGVSNFKFYNEKFHKKKSLKIKIKKGNKVLHHTNNYRKFQTKL